MKKTVVLGASPNPGRYSHMATERLLRYGHEVVPVGIRKGEIGGLSIHTDKPPISDVDTITLYVGPDNQPSWYEYILSLKPKRIIFNPGTENPELIQLAREAGIEPAIACTLVMLGTGTY